MEGPSITHWNWLKRPDIMLKDGVFVDELPAIKYIRYFGSEYLYRPGEHISSLLSSIQKVVDDHSALLFVRDWGLLGLLSASNKSQERTGRFNGAVEFTYATRKRQDPKTDLGEIIMNVSEYYGYEKFGDSRQSREASSDVIRFAGLIRHISEMKRFIHLYRDPGLVEKDTIDLESNQWVNRISREMYKALIGPDLEYWKTQYEQIRDKPYFLQYLLEATFHDLRVRFSHRSKGGVWVQLHSAPYEDQPDGFPMLQFDGLFRFIEYILLIEPMAFPQRCTDPKCGHLFFPAREGQRYCPALSDEKRSRCEQRHGQSLRRAKKKEGQA